MKRFTNGLRKTDTLHLLLLPSFIGLLCFYLLPFFASLYFALIHPEDGSFAGLYHFKDVAASGAFLLAVKNTLFFMALCIPLNMALPLGIALLLNRQQKARSVCLIMILIPLVIPSGSIVYFWKSIFSMNGVINGLFFMESPQNWLETDWARGILTLIFIWKNAGYNVVLFLAGLTFIPENYYEYASLEGAGRWKQFTGITMVYITPTLFLVFFMSLTNALKAFREIYMLAGAYPHQSVYMLQHYMNNQFASLNYQKLSASSHMLSIVMILFVWLLYYGQNKISKDL